MKNAITMNDKPASNWLVAPKRGQRVRPQMSVDMEPQMGVGTAQAGAHQEVDEGLRVLAPQPQPAKFLGIGSGLVAAGAQSAARGAIREPHSTAVNRYIARIIFLSLIHI